MRTPSARGLSSARSPPPVACSMYVFQKWLYHWQASSSACCSPISRMAILKRRHARLLSVHAATASSKQDSKARCSSCTDVYQSGQSAAISTS
eukprot:1488691-Pyramimonas_sp.AAC.1